MEAVDADIWVLTETRRDFAPPGQYTLAGCSGDAALLDAKNQWTWVAIWSRLPVLDPCPTSDPMRTVAVRIEPATGRPVIVHGIVLPARVDDQRFVRGSDAFTAALREQSITWETWRRSFPDQALCVAGDFNQELGGPIRVGFKASRDFLSARLKAANLTCLTGGDDDPVIRETNEASMDHLCIGASLRAAGQPKSVAWPCEGALRTHSKGHFPIYADIGYADPPAGR